METLLINHPSYTLINCGPYPGSGGQSPAADDGGLCHSSASPYGICVGQCHCSTTAPQSFYPSTHYAFNNRQRRQINTSLPRNRTAQYRTIKNLPVFLLIGNGYCINVFTALPAKIDLKFTGLKCIWLMQEVTEVHSLTKPIRFFRLTPVCMSCVSGWTGTLVTTRWQSRSSWKCGKLHMPSW